MGFKGSEVQILSVRPFHRSLNLLGSSSVGRTADSDSVGRRFESCLLSLQILLGCSSTVERGFLEPNVKGSIPFTPAIFESIKMTIEQNYEKTKQIPQYFLGQLVTTKQGRGIIVKLEMPTNGLYISPERTTITVWFGCGNDSERWVQLLYSIAELEEEMKLVSDANPANMSL